MLNNNEYPIYNIKLIQSMVVKCSVTAYKFQLDRNAPLTDAKSDWVYYKHIKGDYHSSDTPIVIEHKRLPANSILSKTLLTDNDWLLDELRERDTLYNDLISKNKESEILIRGMLTLGSIDIDTMIESVDGTIMYVDNLYMDVKEYDLVNDLNTFTTNYYHRWLVKDLVVVDKNYMPTFLASFYQQVLLKLIAIRIDNIQTYEVHDYYIYLKLMSTFNLGDSVLLTSPEFRLWIYNNIDYLIENLGSNENLELLVEKINSLTEVKVSYMSIVSREPSYKVDTSIYEPNFELENVLIYLTEPGSDDILTEVVTSNLISKELALLKHTSVADNNFLHTNRLLINNPITKLRTKVLQLTTESTVFTEIEDFLKIAIDSLAENYNDTTLYPFKDTLKDKTYYITPKIALVLCLDIFNIMLGKERTIRTIRYDVYEPRDINTYIMEISKTTVTPYLKSLLYPTNTPMETASKYIKLYDTYFTLLANISNNFITGDIKRVVNNFRVSKSLGINVFDVNAFLYENDISFSIRPEHDLYQLLGEILVSVTGIDINRNKRMDKLVLAINNIITELTTYSTQVLDNVGETDIKLRTIAPKPFTDKPFGNLGIVNSRCLEENDGLLEVKLDDQDYGTKVYEVAAISYWNTVDGEQPGYEF